MRNQDSSRLISPNGRYVAAIPLDSLKLMLFDFTTQKWTELAPDGSPLFVRDASIQEIYALDWETP